jgi:hypothetical protein
VLKGQKIMPAGKNRRRIVAANPFSDKALART